MFPTRSPIDRKLPWLKWALLIFGACFGWGGIRHGNLEALPFIRLQCWASPPSTLTNTIVGYGVVILGMASLLWNVIGAPRVEDRRRLNVMLWGTLVGVTPAILIGIPYDLAHSGPPFWLGFAQGTFLFLLPLSFAYAVLKHRVMAIPVLLRRSARYLLVERGFAILILLISVGLTLWFGQAFSKRFMAGSKAAFPIGATFGVLLITAATQVHRRVRTRLDRAFFRSAYDAQQILENLAANTLAVTDREGLANLLNEQTEDALHPQPLYVYLQAADGHLHAFTGDPPAEAINKRTQAFRRQGRRSQICRSQIYRSFGQPRQGDGDGTVAIGNCSCGAVVQRATSPRADSARADHRPAPCGGGAARAHRIWLRPIEADRHGRHRHPGSDPEIRA